MATQRSELTDTLAGISLFADVGTAELNAIAHIVEERRYAAGERILRQGISGSAFYIILDGEAAPAGRVPGRHRRQRAGRTAALLCPGPCRGPARGHLRRSVPGRDVPAVAVLPAAAVVDQAVRAGGARHALLRALRLELAHRRRGPAARDPAGPDGRHFVLPRADGDGAEPRHVRARGRPAGALRLPLDRDPPGGRPLRPRNDRR